MISKFYKFMHKFYQINANLEQIMVMRVLGLWCIKLARIIKFKEESRMVNHNYRPSLYDNNKVVDVDKVKSSKHHASLGDVK